MDDVAPTDAGGVESACRGPRIGAGALRLPQRSRRDEDSTAGECRDVGEAAEGRIRRLQFHQVGFAQHGNARQRGAAVDRVRVDALEPAGEARNRCHRAGEEARQAAEQGRFTLGLRARLKRVEMDCHRSSRRFRELSQSVGEGASEANVAPRAPGCQTWPTFLVRMNCWPVEDVQLSCAWVARAQLTVLVV